MSKVIVDNETGQPVHPDSTITISLYHYDKKLDEIERLTAENKRLADALEKLARLGNEPHYGNSDGNMIARKALGDSDG
jgi:hypothetical protein